jgi:RNA polymerase sigma-70 factor (ECF subfamily)
VSPLRETEQRPTTSYREFYTEEWRPAVALAYALCGDRGLAEDIAQESLVAALRKWSTISTYDLPGAWLRRVVVHKASSVMRRRIAEASSLARWRARPTRPELDLDEHDAEVWRLVAALPRRQAQATALHYLEDMSSKQIADILGCNEATVRVHLLRARRTLAVQLGETLEEGDA